MCMCQNEYESGIKNKKMTESINGSDEVCPGPYQCLYVYVSMNVKVRKKNY